MVKVVDAAVPPKADRRLDELADILARAVLRLDAKKSGFGGDNSLEVFPETRLSVTTSDDRKATR